MLAIFPISNGYKILGLFHILAVVIAFGPLFLYPTLHRAGQSQTIARLHLMMALPALVLVWVFGMGLVGMSDDAVEMTETWIVLSLIGWVLAMVVSWFLIRPALTDRSATARSRLSAGIGITHLLLLVIVILMVFKPGSDLT